LDLFHYYMVVVRLSVFKLRQSIDYCVLRYRSFLQVCGVRGDFWFNAIYIFLNRIQL